MKNKKQQIIKRTVSGILFLLSMLCGWQAANAQTTINHNIGTGDLTIPGNSTDNYIITGTTTTNRIIVNSGYQGTITLTNVDITASGGYPPVRFVGVYNQSNLNPTTKANIILSGNNSVVHTGNNGYAAIQVDQGTQIHISAIDPANNASGTLYASARDETATQFMLGGAGIGNSGANGGTNYVHGTAALSCSGQGNTGGGNIIISSGTITARGGHAAGIGGGYNTYYDGIIIIYGGVVESIGGYDSAGIGSGCPLGTGVIACHSPNSAIVVLPPAQITALGAGAHGAGGVGMTLFPTLGLAGTASITYLNDPDKPLVTIRTSDNEPNADMYMDLSEDEDIYDIFDALDIPYDLSAVKFGTTNAAGLLTFHAQLNQPTTFFTDAASSQPETLGRPYRPVTTTIPATPMTQEIVLPLLDVNIALHIYPTTSTPLDVGYTSAQAQTNAYRIKLTYLDPDPMTGVTYGMQAGATSDFGPLLFYAADSITLISAPTTLTNGMEFYIVVPLKTGKPTNVYTDVLRFSGTWQGLPTGYIRQVATQRVVLNDTGVNSHIKVTASPPTLTTANAATASTTLTLNITHSGLNITYDPADVLSRYLITTEPDYNAALAAQPIEGWAALNIPAANGVNQTTAVSFSGKPSGIYYIHWFVISGTVFAHSTTAVSPPNTYGAFGPYAIVSLLNDLATAIEYGDVAIDVLANDVLPPALVGSITSLADSVIVPPVSGKLYSLGRQILYEHTAAATLTNSIDSFTYRITAGGVPLTAKVYVYVIQSSTGSFAACYNTTHTVDLKGTNVNYYWYNAAGSSLLSGVNPGSQRTIAGITADQTFQIRPERTAAPYQGLAFPMAPLTVRVANPGGAPVTMRWTGLQNTAWLNPGNWVMVNATYESPATFAPTGCVNVLISKNVARWPELTQAVACSAIRLEDRAMIKNTHLLTYDNASVEIRFNPAEKDRFVMWSAPLLSMYSGDYHYMSGSQIQLGDVYMTFFQHANPAGGSAQPNMFTATFGQLGEPLPLGRAFNLRVMATSENREKFFTFPQLQTSYTDANGVLYNSLTRTNGSRFITHGQGATFALPVSGAGGYSLIQVVNPYLAYLDVRQFLTANTAVLASGYKIWDGNVNGDFVDILYSGDAGYQPGQRYRVTTTPTLNDLPDYIPPLQSFFVAKKVLANNITSLQMSSDWTTTAVQSAPYVLRNAEEESGILRIKASQGNRVSYAVIRNDPAAIPEYSGDEDSPKLFYEELPVSVYTLTPMKEPLAINSTGDFTREIGLGLRIGNTGEVTLDFSRLAGFGQFVYLIDHASSEGRKEINLQDSPSYTFTAAKPTGSSDAIVIDSRFSLRFESDPDHIEAVEADHDMQVSSANGYLYVQSPTGVISSLRVYNISGATVYGNDTPSDRFRISVEGKQTYLVKGKIGDTYRVRKIFVK
jgi:hypothetical protein